MLYDKPRRTLLYAGQVLRYERVMRVLAVVLCLVASVAFAQPKPKVDVAGEAAALAGGDLDAAARAAEALGKLDAPAAHDALLDGLALGLPAPVAIPAIAALAAHPAPTDVVAIKRYAGHHDVRVRAAALTALAGYPDPVARQAIVAGLHDKVTTVRAAAAAAAGRGRVRDGIEALFALLAKGEEPAARALAQLADVDLSRKIADHYGKVPDASLALCMGSILKRPDFGPDPARVDIVRAMAKIQDPAAVKQLAEYIDSVPKTQQRPSRQEAEMIVDARTGGK
jgi:HEAT repeat protein